MTVLSHAAHSHLTSFEHFYICISYNINTPYNNTKKQEEGLLSQELAKSCSILHYQLLSPRVSTPW